MTPAAPAAPVPVLVPAAVPVPVPAAVTLLPAQRSLRAPRTGITPRLVRMAWRGINWIGNALQVVAMIGFLFLAIGPHLLDYRTETMLTGSMSPTIKVGDVVVDTRTSVSKLRVGDIVTYRIPVDDQRVVSHRVVQIRHNSDGSTTFQTRGDANPVDDPWTATVAGGKLWQVHAVVPKLGVGIRLLRNPEVAGYVRFGAPALVVLLALLAIWRRESAHRQPVDPHDVQYLEKLNHLGEPR